VRQARQGYRVPLARQDPRVLRETGVLQVQLARLASKALRATAAPLVTPDLAEILVRPEPLDRRAIQVRLARLAHRAAQAPQERPETLAPQALRALVIRDRLAARAAQARQDQPDRV